MATVTTSTNTSALGIACNPFQAAIVTNVVDNLARMENDNKYQLDAISIQGIQLGEEMDNPEHYDSINLLRVIEHFEEGVVVIATVISTGKGLMLDSSDPEVLSVLRESVQLAESSATGFHLGQGVRLGGDGEVEIVDITDDAAFRNPTTTEGEAE